MSFQRSWKGINNQNTQPERTINITSDVFRCLQVHYLHRSLRSFLFFFPPDDDFLTSVATSPNQAWGTDLVFHPLRSMSVNLPSFTVREVLPAPASKVKTRSLYSRVFLVSKWPISTPPPRLRLRTSCLLWTHMRKNSGRWVDRFHWQKRRNDKRSNVLVCILMKRWLTVVFT